MKIHRYKNFLAESANDFSFKSVINARDVDYNMTDDMLDKAQEQYVDALDLNIDWEMDFDIRQSGLNSVGVVINKIYGNYTVVTPAEEGRDGEDEKELVIERNSKDWDVQTQYEGDFEFGNSFYPQSIEIDFKTKKVFVKF
jgi:hypothetical protein